MPHKKKIWGKQQRIKNKKNFLRLLKLLQQSIFSAVFSLSQRITFAETNRLLLNHKFCFTVLVFLSCFLWRKQKTFWLELQESVIWTLASIVKLQLVKWVSAAKLCMFAWVSARMCALPADIHLHVCCAWKKKFCQIKIKNWIYALD